MTRDVDLVSYLPPFLTEFSELTTTLEAENPEFVLVWDGVDRVLHNEFIETADEYGISRFEKILNILPSKEDTLESRRARVLARWFTNVPYTIKALLSKLQNLCGESSFSISTDYDFYKITIVVDLELFGQVDELDYIIESMIPCNIITVTTNKIPCNIKGNALVGSGLCFVHDFTASNDFNEQCNASGSAFVGGRSQFTTHFFITNDIQEAITPKGIAGQGGAAVNTAFVTISDNFNESYDINGLNSVGSAVTLSETIGANT